MNQDQQIPTWHILHIDDDEEDHIIVRAMLDGAQSRKVVLDWASTLDAARHKMNTNHYQAILVDYDLGSGTGIELIREFVQRGYHTPMILLTGRGSYEVDLEAMHAGATLYLTKNEINPLLLERSIRYATERKQVEAQLKESSEALREAHERAAWLARIPEENPRPVLRVTREGVILYRNPVAAKLSWLGEVGQRVPEEIQQLVYQALIEKSELTKEIGLAGRFYSVVLAPVPAEQYVNLYFLDITDHHLAKAAIQASEERWATTLASIGDAVIATDADCRVTFMNAVAETLTGWKQVEASGHNITEIFNIVNESTRQPVVNPADQAIRLGEVVALANHTILIRKDGSEVYIDDSGAPIRDAQGKMIGAVLVFRDITERKQAEAELRANSEELRANSEALKQRSAQLEAARIAIENEKLRLEAVMRALPVGLAMTDAQGGSIQTNPAFEQVWGGPARPAATVDDYVAYQGWWADTGQPVQPEQWASAQAVRKGETVQGQIIEIQRFDGQRSFVMNSASPILDANGQIIGSAVVIQDINQVKQSETLNRILSDINRVLLSTLDFESVMQAALLASRKALGSETAAISLCNNGHWEVRYVSGFPQEVIGARMNDDEERHAVLAIQTQQPVAINDAFTDERVNQAHMRKWGVRSVLVVPILMRGAAIGVMFFNYQSAPFEFREYHLQFGVNLAASISAALENARLFESLKSEIHEREKVQAKLQASTIALRERNASLHISEQRWAMTLSSIGDAVIATDHQGQVTFMNPVAEELTGWTLAEAAGQSMKEVFKIVNEQTRQTVESPVDKVLEQGKIVGLANHTILIRKDGVEIPIDDSGAPIRDVNGNITGVVLVFRDIQERKQTEKALAEYAHKLEQSNHELENFAFVASHDLQEPLRKIEGFSKLVSDKAGSRLEETERDYLERMRVAAERMRKMIDDLLSLSRVMTQGQPFTAVDLNQVAGAVLEALDNRIQQTGGSVEIDPLPVVKADPTQMHQLFQNLIGNALKFRKPNEQPLVRVKASPLPDQWIEIRFEDNGIGFDMTQAGRLFQPFQRLHGRSEYEGTGIGLSICRKIVERHGGRITVDSQPGKGSTFSVYLKHVK